MRSLFFTDQPTLLLACAIEQDKHVSEFAVLAHYIITCAEQNMIQ